MKDGKYLFETFHLPHKCFVCEKFLITEPHQECEVCGWVDDVDIATPEYRGPENKMSFNEAVERYENGDTWVGW